ncbi:MAG: hypothetical protein F4Y76_01845 [Acidimicrobiales bacterium]|nr:hypothetical protein [Acidimicrobiales bacterium]MYG60606.1 hypothetical protein [Acidimicrobiales bacterium]
MNTIRRRLRTALRNARRDTRGVALQTVIVIVVLLVIAGSVSAVLLSRSSDVVGELENVSIGGLTEETCPITSIGGVAGKVVTAVAADGWGSAGDKGCVWDQEAADKTETDVTAAQCFAGGGGSLDTVAAEHLTHTGSAKRCVFKFTA